VFLLISGALFVVIVIGAVASLSRDGISVQRVVVTFLCSIAAMIFAAVCMWVFYLSKIHIG
jgi:hypothetical protein